MKGLRGKLALVTGAGAGIGKAIVTRLAEEGVDVVVTDVNVDSAKATAAELKAKFGVKSVAMRLDVTSAEEVESAVESAWKDHGPLNILVNNAGVSTMNPVVDLTEKDWDFNMDVNAKGTFLVSRAVVRKFLKHDYGSEKPKIVNVASMAGKYGAAYLAHYSASKFAVVGFSQSLALELAPAGITVNCVCPGYVQTSMQERELAWEGKIRGMTPEQVKAEMLAHVPLGRLETPEDVAKLVAFLCSRDSDYITGQAINVSGGQALI